MSCEMSIAQFLVDIKKRGRSLLAPFFSDIGQ